MAKPKLSDAQAKEILRKWPQRTRSLWAAPDSTGYWLRAQPGSKARARTPRIFSPGADLFGTQPDGMWVYFREGEFADAVCVEVCGTVQNLNDKRSRYAATVRSLILRCPAAWFKEGIKLQRGGLQPRWQACRTISSEPAGDLALPIRWLRVLYALPNDIYAAWVKNNVPGGHEYFCRHSSLDSYTSQETQRFLRQLAHSSHFRTSL